MSALIYSSSLLAAFLGGMLALFAPCCIVSLLPVYVGSAVGRGRRRLPATTGLFALGISIVILPIVLGLGFLSQLLSQYHSMVSLLVGLFLLGLGGLILSGRVMELPIPTLNLRVKGSGPAAVVVLGISSGLASACCAPVFAGVVAITTLGGSVGGSLVLALGYVFGMVFPLFLIALLWDTLHLEGRWRKVLRIPRLSLFRRRLAWTEVTAGAVFLLMGLLSVALALSGRATFTPPWLALWVAWTHDLAGRMTTAAAGIPWWLQGSFLLAAAAILAVTFIVRRSRALAGSLAAK